MTNKERFFACCQTLAYIEKSLDVLKDVGLDVDPGNSGNKRTFADFIYGACDGAIDVAMSYLDIKDFTESERIYQGIMTAGPDNYLEIATEAWKLYGVK